MGAVSPAIVVPALLKVQAKGYDPSKKISTIVIAAASFDDIVAISGFGIFFGMIFNEGTYALMLSLLVALKCALMDQNVSFFQAIS